MIAVFDLVGVVIFTVELVAKAVIMPFLPDEERKWQSRDKGVAKLLDHKVMPSFLSVRSSALPFYHR